MVYATDAAVNEDEEEVDNKQQRDSNEVVAVAAALVREKMNCFDEMMIAAFELKRLSNFLCGKSPKFEDA